MEACEQFYLRRKVITLAEHYFLLCTSIGLPGSIVNYFTRDTEDKGERFLFENLRMKLDDEYRAKLLRAIASARVEKPLDDTQSELDTLANCISNRIALLQFIPGGGAQADRGPLVTEFYKNHYIEAIQLALEPIDIDEIKNHFDEHFPPFRTGPIRPFSCINLNLHK